MEVCHLVSVAITMAMLGVQNQVTAEESVPLVVLLSTIISISVVDMLGTTIPSPPKISRTNFKGKPNRNEWGKFLDSSPTSV